MTRLTFNEFLLSQTEADGRLGCIARCASHGMPLPPGPTPLASRVSMLREQGGDDADAKALVIAWHSWKAENRRRRSVR